MKVIELLNKIANGDELPKKFKFKGWIFTYNKEEEGYIEDRDNPYWLDYYINVNTPEDLSLEIEIIEEDNKIEKIDYDRNTNFRNIVDKINEIIDKLNKEEK